MSTLARQQREVGSRPVGFGRLGTTAAWISAVCCLPYLVLKVLWTVDVPLGISDRSVLDSSDWVAGNAIMAVLQLAGLLLVLALTQPWARRVPTWLLLFPVWVGTGLLFEIVVGAVLMVFSVSSGASTESSDLGGIQAWVYVMVYASFAGQGVALAIAFACHVQARWGRLLRERTGEVLARRSSRSWPEDHLAAIAELVAAMALGVAVVCAYWAVGGSTGASGARPDPPWTLQVAGMVSAVVAAVGLLGLAGRWAGHARLWVPVALTWVGSGAMAAFDGLLLTFFLVFGADISDVGWGPTDAVLLIKVLIGGLAAVVGAFALTAAARFEHDPEAVATRR